MLRVSLGVLSTLLILSVAGLGVVGNSFLAAKADATTLRAKLMHPTVGIWNSCNGPCTIKFEQFRAGSVGDTFTTHLAFTSDQNVVWAFLTLEQFVNLSTLSGACRTLRGPRQFPGSRTANCLTLLLKPTLVVGESIYVEGRDGSGKDVKIDFHLAEGCGSYIYVLTPDTTGRSATVLPNVTATYNPASAPTGVCATSG